MNPRLRALPAQWVEVPQARAWLAYCLDCGQTDCPRWLADHKRLAGHEHVCFVAPAPVPQTAPIAPAGQPAVTTIDTGPRLSCAQRFARARRLCRQNGHAVPDTRGVWAGWRTATCVQCGETVTRSVEAAA